MRKGRFSNDAKEHELLVADTYIFSANRTSKDFRKSRLKITAYMKHIALFFSKQSYIDHITLS